MASTIFGSFNNEQQVTVNGNQQVRGRKTFLNAGNEYAGTFVDPTFTVNGVSITSTEISYLEDAAGNIQDQLDDKLDLTGGTLTGNLDIDLAELHFTALSSNTSTISADQIQLLEDGGGREVNVDLNHLYIRNDQLFDTTDCSFGPVMNPDWHGAVVRTGVNSQLYSAALGFFSSQSQNPCLALEAQNDQMKLTSNSFVASSPGEWSAFTFQAPNMFLKFDCGSSFKVDIDDHHIERDMAFKVVNNGGSLDFHNYEYYLAPPSQTAGWSVIVSEGSGTDATITNPDGLWFYGHGIPGYTQQGSFPLKKWSTARITLVPSITYAPGFAWAVSMY